MPGAQGKERPQDEKTGHKVADDPFHFIMPCPEEAKNRNGQDQPQYECRQPGAARYAGCRGNQGQEKGG